MAGGIVKFGVLLGIVSFLLNCFAESPLSNTELCRMSVKLLALKLESSNMAYDTPKAAHFELRDEEGFEVLTTQGVTARWVVAGFVAQEFPDLLGLTEKQVVRIDEICAKVSTEKLTVTFRHHREF